MTRLALMLSILVPGVALSQGLYLIPAANCSSPSAACLASSFTATSSYTFTGTGVALTSSANAALELRSGAVGATTGFKLYTTNNLSGTILDIGEIISGTPTAAMTLDQNTLSLFVKGIELQGAKGIASNSGGSEDPMVIKGGVVSTANTSRVVSAQDGFGVRQFDVRAGLGGYQLPGVATGSLVTCNGSASGLYNHDNTKGAPTFCDGTAQRTVPYILPFNGTQDVGSLAAGACTNFTIPATGIVDADVVFCDKPSNLSVGAWAVCDTFTDVIGWQVCNFTGGTYDPPDAAYNARILRP